MLFLINTKLTIYYNDILKKLLLIVSNYYNILQCFTFDANKFSKVIDISNIPMYNNHMDYMSAVKIYIDKIVSAAFARQFKIMLKL